MNVPLKILLRKYFPTREELTKDFVSSVSFNNFSGKFSFWITSKSFFIINRMSLDYVGLNEAPLLENFIFLIEIISSYWSQSTLISSTTINCNLWFRSRWVRNSFNKRTILICLDLTRSVEIGKTCHIINILNTTHWWQLKAYHLDYWTNSIDYWRPFNKIDDDNGWSPKKDFK